MQAFIAPALALCAFGLAVAPACAQNAQTPPSAGAAVGRKVDTDPGPVEVAKYLDFEPGHDADARAALRAYAAAVRRQSGDLFVWTLDEDGRPTRFAVVERWKDALSYKAHLGSPAVAQFDKETAAFRRAPIDERAHSDLAGRTDGGAPLSAVFILAHLDVTPPHRSVADDLLKTLAAASGERTGALDFGAFPQRAQTNHFTLVEVWRDRATFDAYGAASATLAFRQAIAPLIGALYDERIYKRVD